jgi:hypothetical protein
MERVAGEDSFCSQRKEEGGGGTEWPRSWARCWFS